MLLTSVDIPNWIVVLISAIISAAISAGVAFIVKRALTKYFERRDTEEQVKEKKLRDYEELRKKEREDNLKKIIKESIKEETDPILEKLTNVENGTLDALRDRILSIYYRCYEKGYRTQYDFENVHHMHVDYKKLNGNSFVEDCIKKFDELPSEEEFKKTKKKSRATSKSKDKIILG